MALARLLARTLAAPSSSRILPFRALSAKVEVPEIDLPEDSSSSSASDEPGAGGGASSSSSASDDPGASGGASSSSSTTSTGPEAGGGEGESAAQMRRSSIDEAMRYVWRIGAAPDWLPFVPGASYWLPPLPHIGVAEVIKAARATAAFLSKLPPGIIQDSGLARGPGMTKEERMSLTSMRGWPSAAYFLEEEKNSSPVKRSKKDANRADDEES